MTTTSASARTSKGPGLVTTPVRPLSDPDFHLVAEAIPHIVWMASPDGATTYFNQQGCKYTGCPPEANYGWDWVAFLHTDDVEPARLAWEHATQTEELFAIEFRIRRFDGAFRWHCVRALPLRDDRGKLTTWIGTATDIEDQRQLELSLRASEQVAIETLSADAKTTSQFGQLLHLGLMV